MRRRFNYTGRRRIERAHVPVSVREVEGAPCVAVLRPSLTAYGFPADADIYVEAYDRALCIRGFVGKVGSCPERFELALDGVDAADHLRYRVKVSSTEHDFGVSAPLLFGLADQLRATSGNENDPEAAVEKLLTLKPADLRGEVWRLDIADHVVLEIDHRFWQERDFVRQGPFFALALPAMFRQILTVALDGDDAEYEDSASWSYQWIRFAVSLSPDRERPSFKDLPREEIDEWITGCVQRLCRDHGIADRFERVLKGEKLA